MSSRTVFLIAFGLFTGAIVFSLSGAFLLQFAPTTANAALVWIADNIGPTLDMLIKGPTWLYMALLPVLGMALYWRELGPARSFAFLLVGSVIGGGAELLGTTTGFPFGAYEYNEMLGAKFAGHVPYFIPPSWYAISIVSLDLARRTGVNRWGRVALVAVLMVLWDVALDPAMNYAFPFWTYGIEGAFFGMPWVNWAGWLLTSAVIALAYEMLGGLNGAPTPFVERWGPRFYALNTLFAVGICFAYKVPLAGLAGLAALAAAFGLLAALKARFGAAVPRTVAA
ncbi:MAG: bisanhydrobacterioruberin hydratase CruF [Bacteroidota bacterium]